MNSSIWKEFKENCIWITEIEMKWITLKKYFYKN
jgi:hypothetical protein